MKKKNYIHAFLVVLWNKININQANFRIYGCGRDKFVGKVSEGILNIITSGFPPETSSKISPLPL